MEGASKTQLHTTAATITAETKTREMRMKMRMRKRRVGSVMKEGTFHRPHKIYKCMHADMYTIVLHVYIHTHTQRESSSVVSSTAVTSENLFLYGG